jgi:hypothetical protein
VAEWAPLGYSNGSNKDGLKMKKLALLSAVLLLAIACGSPAVKNVAKTNVNAVNAVPYSQTENAYKLAQTDLGIAPLKEFVGKTASEMKLWQNKIVVRGLEEMMGSDFATMRKFWNTETPLKKFGDIMMLTGCEKGNCGDNRYVIFLSTSEGLLKVVHIGKNNVKEWSTRRDIYLPPLFEEELAAMKSRK